MSQLPNIGLQPAARPVDTFSPSEVRMDSGGAEAHSLGQVAAALSEFNGSLATVAGQYIMAGNERAAREGAADAARYQNMDAFKAAVDRGEIKETDNPWYRIQLQQGFNEIRARGAVNEWRNWLASSPDAEALRNADDPDVIDKAFDSMVGPILRTMDSHSVNRVLPELQQAKQAIIMGHMAERDRERKAEMEQVLTVGTRSDASSVAFANDIGGVTMNPEATRQVTQQSAALIQTRLDDAMRTMNKLDAVKAIVSGVMEQGIATANPDLARSILNEVKVDGKSLATIYGPELAHHEEAVTELQVRRMDRAIHLDNIKLKQMEDDAVAAASDLKPEDWSAFVMKMDPRLRANIANKLSDFGGNLQHISEFGAKSNLIQAITESPELRPRTLAERYALIKDPEHYFSVHSNQWADHTDPVIKTQLYDYMHDHGNTMSYELLRGMGLSKQVSENDYEQFMKFVPGLNEKNPLAKFETAIGQGDDVIKGLLIGGMIVSNRMQFSDNPISAELEVKMAQARLDYRDWAKHLVLNQGKDMSPEQLSTALTSLAETAAVKATGVTIDRIRALNDTEAVKRKFETLRKNAEHVDPLNVSTGRVDQSKYRVSGYESQEVSFSSLPRLFESAQEYESARKDLAKWAASKGLKLPADKNEQKDFLLNQSDLLIKAGIAVKR